MTERELEIRIEIGEKKSYAPDFELKIVTQSLFAF